MKGIILAGGLGTRLYPLTTSLSKQLLPIYDKPMIYYPLSILMLSGIKEILIVSTPKHIKLYQAMLGNGSLLGLNLQYISQEKPEGLAQALILGEEFLNGDDVCLILGDNIIYGDGLTNLLLKAKSNTIENKKATIFAYYVNDPERYGIVELDERGEIKSINEKPKNPKSNYAIIGLYFYPNSVVEISKSIKPSDRGELEISSVNDIYLKRNQINLKKLGRGHVWMDTGTIESMYNASTFVKTIQNRQNLKIACIEEIAFYKNFISKDELIAIINKFPNSEYGEYLKKKYLL